MVGNWGLREKKRKKRKITFPILYIPIIRNYLRFPKGNILPFGKVGLSLPYLLIPLG